MLKVNKLSHEFASSISNLIEVLHDKERGYGIVTIEIDNLIFGIPLRTNLNHSYGVKLDKVEINNQVFHRGLDFRKAILIKDISNIGAVFNVSSKQKRTLIAKEKAIKNQFSKYVNNYIKAKKNNIENTINSNAYKFSTLINYHEELGIKDK